MEREIFLKMDEIEASHWWFQIQRMLVKRFFPLRKRELFLDIGCGTGNTLASLLFFTGVGLGIKPLALALCRSKGLPHLLQADASALPFQDEAFHGILILGVLYHQGIKEERKVLKEAWRVLKKDGVLLITEPAFEFLRRSHDVVEHTRKRFTREELTQLVSGTGFNVLKTSYIYSYALPLLMLIKFLRLKREGSDLYLPPVVINAFFKLLGYLEIKLLPFFSFPFGSTVFVLGRKEEK